MGSISSFVYWKTNTLATAIYTHTQGTISCDHCDIKKKLLLLWQKKPAVIKLIQKNKNLKM
jgi:hypothetical protein